MEDTDIVRRSVFARFLPAAAGLYLVVLTGIAVKDPGSVGWHQLVVAGLQLATLTAGFGLALTAARVRVGRAPRMGVRAAAAGLLAPLGLAALSAFTQGATPTAIGVFGVAAGASAAGLLIASTFGRHKQEPSEADPELREEIARLEAELAAPPLRSGISPGNDLLTLPERVPVVRELGGDSTDSQGRP